MVALCNRADHYIFILFLLLHRHHLCSAGRPSGWALAHILVTTILNTFYNNKAWCALSAVIMGLWVWSAYGVDITCIRGFTADTLLRIAADAGTDLWSESVDRSEPKITGSAHRWILNPNPSPNTNITGNPNPNSYPNPDPNRNNTKTFCYQFFVNWTFPRAHTTHR